jgi:Fe-S-cluster-containing dehydrogenase component
MYWECTECGYRLEEDRRPRCCANCGTAGVIFVEATREIEGDDFAESAMAAWLERGMRWSPKRQAATT